MNCTGRNCPMQRNTVDPANCQAASDCIYATPPITNADRIRAMSDGELAEIMALWCPPNYPHECHRYKKSDGDLNCSKCWFDWLRAEEDET